MNYLEKWQHNNQEYLTKVLLWLRLCLKRQVQTLEKGKEIPQPKEVSPTKQKQRFFRLDKSEVLHLPALPADERIVNYIKGLNYLDDRLVSLVTPLDGGNIQYQLPQSHQQAVEAIATYLQPSRTPLVIQLLGSDSSSKQLLAQQAAQSMGLFVYRLSLELLPSQAAELETFIRLWERESLLLPIILYLDAQEITSSPTEAQNTSLYRFLNRTNSLLFLSSREIRSNLGRPTVPIDIEKPTPEEQKQLWQTALGNSWDDIPAQLASQFNLNLPTIEQISQTALTTASNQNLRDKIWSTCLANTRPQLDILAQRLNPKATWEDIVLPPEETSLLQQIADQVRQRSKVYQEWGFENRMNRGLGINALFAGESGTGKTMAAEVIANELRLNLYRIDLSAVVSKYIGETEKNLRRLFDAAEDGGAILFFDEADALFGKRSEVKDSHDRYANIEINYLLQRMEAFRGLAILATNMRSALDHAFVRRLRFILTFQFPNPPERQKIWQKAFPREVPRENLDFARLARLNLTGGSIHNIALNAAFLAAQQGTGVTMPLALQAARTEFRKLDRPINEVDFRWEEPVGVKV
ncbi:ATP-binding protein [Calothrix rhizosoleniae]|uniref:ATP-binding protein n=1 Tax=Calothrix rhizosoleniae TaxID=888997 RepID=UPI000B49E88A|nr:ATP-binding protein [Calothrix rhizosoleniae]